MYSVQILAWGGGQELFGHYASIRNAVAWAKAMSRTGEEVKITRNGRFIGSYRSGKRLS